jgi:energy-coupling factor transporter ATP-binding protein EcfA2
MSDVKLLVGPSGSGKSTSFRTLDPDKTMIICITDNRLPFPKSGSMYNKERGNKIEYKDIPGTTMKERYDVIINYLEHVSEKKEEIKTVIIDDAGYLMSMELMERAKETGFKKFTEAAMHMTSLLTKCRTLRDDLDIVLTFHEDLTIVDGITPIRDIRLPGKLVKDQFHPSEICTTTVYMDVSFDKEKNAVHNFVVKKTPDYVKAKSPMGMFESSKIPNDLKLLLDTAREYYN